MASYEPVLYLSPVSHLCTLSTIQCPCFRAGHNVRCPTTFRGTEGLKQRVTNSRACSANKKPILRMLSRRVTNFRACSSNQFPCMLSQQEIMQFLSMLSQRVTNFRACSANEKPIFVHAQPTSNQFPHMYSQKETNFAHAQLTSNQFSRMLNQQETNFRACSAHEEITTHFNIIIQNILNI